MRLSRPKDPRLRCGAGWPGTLRALAETRYARCGDRTQETRSIFSCVLGRLLGHAFRLRFPSSGARGSSPHTSALGGAPPEGTMHRWSGERVLEHQCTVALLRAS